MSRIMSDVQIGLGGSNLKKSKCKFCCENNYPKANCVAQSSNVIWKT